MIFHRRSIRDEIIEPETDTPAGNIGLLTVIRDLLHSAVNILKVVAAVTVVLLVTTIALQFQVSSRNRDIRTTQQTSQDAKAAAVEAKQAVQDAIAQSRQGGSINPEKIVESLDAISRIENYLCGGPCPSK